VKLQIIYRDVLKAAIQVVVAGSCRTASLVPSAAESPIICLWRLIELLFLKDAVSEE
jgi:hypothetical protein